MVEVMPSKPSLKPAFVIIAAAAMAACNSGLGDVFGATDPDQKDPERECGKGGCVSNNPPMPRPEPLPAPSFGKVVKQAVPPPALGGATVIMTADQSQIVASDPDRDRVSFVDFTNGTLLRNVDLQAGDEPGRVVEDGDRVHVVLRRAGALATILKATGEVTRRAICAAPRGIAMKGDTAIVACAGGEIMSLARTAATATLLATHGDDLRDVVVQGETIYVSKLRSAEVLKLDAAGTKLDTWKPRAGTPDREVGVAWRMLASDGGVAVVDQQARTTPIDIQQPAAYQSVDPCGGPITTSVDTYDTTSQSSLSGRHIGHAVLPIDMARSSDGKTTAIVAAGNSHTAGIPQVIVLKENSSPPPGFGTCLVDQFNREAIAMQAVAVTFTTGDHLIVLSREPAAVHMMTPGGSNWRSVDLNGASREDTGHAIFHANSGGGISCASCHPEGGEDGRVWPFTSGNRRTQSLRGNLEGTAPYHWGGDAAGIETFATEVFTKKMAGPSLNTEQVEVLKSWLFALPVVPRSPVDPIASARGKVLFENDNLACNSCHGGEKLTNNRSMTVRSDGGDIQVPSLIGFTQHAPYMHDGCATDLNGLTKCGGTAHTKIGSLTAAEQADLSLYLRSL